MTAFDNATLSSDAVEFSVDTLTGFWWYTISARVLNKLYGPFDTEALARKDHYMRNAP
jgi:hypothetical protein